MITLISLVSGILVILATIILIQKSYKISKLNQIVETQFEQIKEYKNKREDFALLMSHMNSIPENSVTDPITQLLSRPAFDKQFSYLIAQSKRFNTLFALIMLDLNKFKDVTSKLSLEKRNKLLGEVAYRLRKTIRDADIAGHYDDDSFTVLLPNMVKPEVIVHAVERIINAINLPVEFEGSEVIMSIYAGIAIYPFDGDDKEALIANVKTALKKAKAGGKNVFQFYQTETQALGERELIVKSAIKSEDFLKNVSLEVKPYYNSTNGEVICTSVSAYLNHAELGKITFDEFVRIAHYSSKMFELYEWMIQSTIAKYNFASNKPGRFIFSFNMKHFETPNFIEKITAIIKKTATDKNEVIIEISDDNLDKINIETFKKSILKLNESNIPIAIGILVLGQLALNKLTDLNFRYLKIDEKLVKDLGRREESQSILQRIMLLASNLNIETITDGVDTQEQKTLLENMGCITMQGKIFKNASSDETFFIKT